MYLQIFTTRNYYFQNLSLEFILKVFLRFRKFQPRYSYKIYSYRKKRLAVSKNSLLVKSIKFDSCGDGGVEEIFRWAGNYEVFLFFSLKTETEEYS